MIRPVNSEHYPILLYVQSKAIEGLTDTYPLDELAKWIDYIQSESANRYARYHNLGYWGDGEIQGFVSWSVDGVDNAAIECLYVSNSYQGKGIGKLLLENAEKQLAGRLTSVRSTLNARPFYEHFGYQFQKSAISRAGFEIACLDKRILH